MNPPSEDAGRLDTPRRVVMSECGGILWAADEGRATMYGCGETALNLWYSIRRPRFRYVGLRKKSASILRSRFPPVNKDT